jgi:F-type H+-transporting ATPase subunit a
MTLALALVFMVVWVWISVRELGVWGSIVHIFGPKGGLQGALKYMLMPIFMFVGVIEVISIVFRPMSLSLRLLGNIFAGETLLHTMGGLGEMLGLPSWVSVITSVVFPLPFYFMEILVGALQATVFALLCAVYIKLSTTHEEEHH